MRDLDVKSSKYCSFWCGCSGRSTSVASICLRDYIADRTGVMSGQGSGGIVTLSISWLVQTRRNPVTNHGSSYASANENTSTQQLQPLLLLSTTSCNYPFSAWLTDCSSSERASIPGNLRPAY